MTKKDTNNSILKKIAHAIANTTICQQASHEFHVCQSLTEERKELTHSLLCANGRTKQEFKKKKKNKKK